MLPVRASRHSVRQCSIKLDVFEGVAHDAQIAFEVLPLYHHSAPAVVGVERESASVLQVRVEEEMHGILRVVDESERRHASRLQSEILHHSLSRSEREFAARRQATRHESLFQLVLKVMYVEVVVTVEAYKIMLVALVVAEKQILAVHAAIIFPPLLSLLNGLALRMIVVGEWYVVLAQVAEHRFFSCHV